MHDGHYRSYGRRGKKKEEKIRKATRQFSSLEYFFLSYTPPRRHRRATASKAAAAPPETPSSPTPTPTPPSSRTAGRRTHTMILAPGSRPRPPASFLARCTCCVMQVSLLSSLPSIHPQHRSAHPQCRHDVLCDPGEPRFARNVDARTHSGTKNLVRRNNVAKLQAAWRHGLLQLCLHEC